MPSALTFLNASINRWVLITLPVFLILGVLLALAQKWASHKKVSNRGSISFVLALVLSLILSYLLVVHRHLMGRFLGIFLPGREIRTLRLPCFAALGAFPVLLILLNWILCKVDCPGIIGKIARVAGTRPAKWSSVVCLVLMLILNISACVIKDRMPNIILITIDTLRQDHLGYSGYGRDTSPNMEKLGANGITFFQATSFSDWTLPSHDNLLTGQYPVSTVIHRIPLSSELLPEILRLHGYRTAAFVSGEWCKRKFGLNQGFDFFDDHFTTGQREIGEFDGAILDWLEKKAERPFFLWLHLFEPHFPYVAHDRYVFKPSQRTRFDEYNKYFSHPDEMYYLWENEVGLDEKDI